VKILPELRQTFPVKYGSLSIDPRHDTSADGVRLSYYEDDRDWEHSFTYSTGSQDNPTYHKFYSMDLSKFRFGGQVSLSRDGRTAIGQILHKDGTASLVELPLKGRLLGFLERQGWLPMPQVAHLPDRATAFDQNPAGGLAVAIQKTVYLSQGNQLQPWKAFQHTVRDVEYLADGTLAVVTEDQNAAGLARFTFHLTAPGEREPTVLPLAEVHPEDYEKDVHQRCARLEFLQGANLAEKERFLEKAGWLSIQPGVFKDHHTLGPDLVAVLEDGLRLFRYDRSTGEAVAGACLELPRQLDLKRPMQSLDNGRWVVLDDRDVALWDARSGKLACLLPEVRELQVTPEGQLSFTDPEGGRHLLPPDQAHTVKEQQWYQRALAARLLERPAQAPQRTTIEMLDGQLRVGSALLRIRR
jgi:hypothetical protein